MSHSRVENEAFVKNAIMTIAPQCGVHGTIDHRILLWEGDGYWLLSQTDKSGYVIGMRINDVRYVFTLKHVGEGCVIPPLMMAHALVSWLDHHTAVDVYLSAVDLSMDEVGRDLNDGPFLRVVN